MYPYWEPITKPLLTLLQPKLIVEIGAEQGKSTHLLLAFCREHDAVLHAIDPAPTFDVAAWQALHDDRFVFHATTSLEALPQIEGYDAVLIDGDHNWYTVFHELKIIEAQCAAHQAPFPLVLFHDIDWPYGRRDLYYDPDAIPEAFRHPYARQGVRPGDSGLQQHGGYSANLFHATTEGTPRNGVRTAIEDFLEQTPLALDFIAVPGFHGLGVLFPRTLRTAHPALSQALDDWTLPPPLRRYIERLESARVHVSVQKIEQTLILKKSLTAMQAKLLRMNERIKALTNNLQSQRAELKRLQQQNNTPDQPAETSEPKSAT